MRDTVNNKLSNNYFQFKKFTIQQEKCSMKVCTDSCVFAAWIADKIKRNVISPANILDIGTGTGLLSLMLAQKCTAQIHAVDIDRNCIDQASENFEASPWRQRLHAFYTDIKELDHTVKYDLIISNPPFYENDLMPEDSRRSVSKHSSALHLEDLLLKVKDVLAENGSFALLLPWSRSAWFEKAAAKYSLFVHERVEIKQTPHHNYFRSVLLLKNHKADVCRHELTIKDNDVYTSEFIQLLKDYYLYL